MSLGPIPLPPIAASGQTSARFDDGYASPMGSPAVRAIPAAPIVSALDVTVFLAAIVPLLFTRQGEGWLAASQSVLMVRVPLEHIGLLIAFACATIGVFWAAGLYEAAHVRRWSDELGRVLISTAALGGLVFYVANGWLGGVDRTSLAYFWAASTAAVVAARSVRARVTQAPERRTVIVGSGPQALRICRELSADPLTRYRVLGFVDTNVAVGSPYVRRRTLGSLDRLETILAREHVDEVQVGLPIRSHYPEIQETIRVCERVGVKLMYRADMFETTLARPRVDRTVTAGPRVELQVVADGPMLLVKRALDIIGATAGLLLLTPALMLIAIAIKATSTGPVIYAQERYGLNRSRFRMFKFRTMVPDAERLQASLEALNEVQGPVFKMARDPRVTPLGRILRRTSLDELPQLFNVLRGDMSLVGPRPLPGRDVSKFTSAADMRRFSVRPGVTGLWQVSGRSGLGFDQWIKLDLHYIDHWSFLLDLTILARTVPAVLRGTGAA